MFSRISVALARSDAVTLHVDDLISVIRDAYNPTPIVYSVENIYDVKSWLRPYVATLKHHTNPHAFRFKLNGKGEVEMSYRPWAKSNRPYWFPKERPITILQQVPPRKPSVLKLDFKKCSTVEEIRASVEKLSVRMTTGQRDWWTNMADLEASKRDQWESLTPEEYSQAGQSFDLLEFQFQDADQDPEEDVEHGKRNERLLQQLLAKKENQLSVKIVKKARLENGETSTP